MRAVVMTNGELSMRDIAPPRPGPGQLLVAPIATGICGSDLSAREHTTEFLAGHERAGARHSIFQPDQPLVLGHEFTSRVLELGEGVEGFQVGDELVTVPFAIDERGQVHTVGYSNLFPGGLASQVVVQASSHLKIPEGVSPHLAAVTEPMATGLNGVLRSRIQVPEGALVTGCGPVGLGAIVELRQRGIYPLVVSDPSQVRRDAALRLGADIAVDPRDVDPVGVWRDMSSAGQGLVVIEASGRAGLVDELIGTVPPYTRICVVGTCMTPDAIDCLVAMLKNIAIEFITGPDRGETAYHALSAMFRHITRGNVDLGAVVTGFTGLEGVGELFEQLRPRDPHDIEHVKVLVRHDLTDRAISPI